jgi:hypothetical protein
VAAARQVATTARNHEKDILVPVERGERAQVASFESPHQKRFRPFVITIANSESPTLRRRSCPAIAAVAAGLSNSAIA